MNTLRVSATHISFVHYVLLSVIPDYIKQFLTVVLVIVCIFVLIYIYEIAYMYIYAHIHIYMKTTYTLWFVGIKKLQ